MRGPYLGPLQPIGASSVYLEQMCICMVYLSGCWLQDEGLKSAAEFLMIQV